MKIECPSCHMTGNINEMELPPDGRKVHCPRCKNNFHVAKPPPVAGLLVTMCPACQYSTFTDETFAVCPKCGVNAGDHKKKLRKQAELEQMHERPKVSVQSHHNPDLVTVVSQRPQAAKVSSSEPVRNTGWLCIGAGGLLLCYGLFGLKTYYGKDWQAILSEPMLEPLSKSRVFFRMGFLPWVITLFSACFVTVASQFLILRQWGRKALMFCALGGIVVATIVEATQFIQWVSVSSSSPSFSYYAVGIMESLFMILLWSAPCCGLIWYLQQKSIYREFPND